ncbi:PREDICTED: trypsin alpha-3-like [Rhagoletis zephyria]|uniref:trypsin alpha-3-like n=1 Tax=Rhagoletis zephyria TaxID=28612 RepID=UPI00081196F5|nr:PREDICTED: trypsin alpha-3-like [Rhagoletis zephyria]
MCLNLVLILQLLMLYFILGHVYSAKLSERIVGGSAVTQKKYRYYVRLHYQGEFKCGGSLLRNNAVLTAAHCVKGSNMKSLRVHADTIRLSDPGVVRSVKNALVSRSYNADTLNYDVAVLILSSAIPSGSFTSITLDKKAVASGTNCLVIGHGYTKEDGSVAQQLQEVSVPVVSRAACQRKYRGTGAITQYMMCASVPGKKDSCSGDSGGPMICSGQQAGIVSWGMGCARTKFPGVYTDISKIYGFVEKVLKQYP